MDKSRKLVKVRVYIGRPKRKSGVYPTFYSSPIIIQSTRERKNAGPISLETFQRLQLEEGLALFDGLPFRIIEV